MLEQEDGANPSTDEAAKVDSEGNKVDDDNVMVVNNMVAADDESSAIDMESYKLRKNWKKSLKRVFKRGQRSTKSNERAITRKRKGKGQTVLVADPKGSVKAGPHKRVRNQPKTLRWAFSGAKRSEKYMKGEVNEESVSQEQKWQSLGKMFRRQSSIVAGASKIALENQDQEHELNVMTDEPVGKQEEDAAAVGKSEAADEDLSSLTDAEAYKTRKTWKQTLKRAFKRGQRSAKSDEGDEKPQVNNISQDQKWHSLGRKFKKQNIDAAGNSDPALENQNTESSGGVSIKSAFFTKYLSKNKLQDTASSAPTKN